MNGCASRQLDAEVRTAAVCAAVLLFAGWGARTQAAEETPSPVSIGVWLYQFAGENDYLADLNGSYERATGRPVELFTHSWGEYPHRTEQWLGDQIRYAPDMLIIHDYHLPAAAGHAASLEGRFPSAFLADLHPALLAQGRLEGVQLAIPWMTAPRALYYRADVLEEAEIAPQQSLDALAQAATDVADPPDMYGFGLPGLRDGGSPDAFMAIYRAMGGLLFNSKGRLAIAEYRGEQALTWLTDILTRGGTQPEVLSWADVELAQLFLDGRLAMLIERPWLLRELISRPPPFEFGVAPVPVSESGHHHITTDCVIVLETARDVDACVDFIQFALSRDQQRGLAGLGVPSVRKDALKRLPQDERWAPFADALAKAHGPSPATWADVGPLVSELLEYTLSGRATPRAALDAIDVQVLDDPEVERLNTIR